jgi:hypothetical protein
MLILNIVVWIQHQLFLLRTEDPAVVLKTDIRNMVQIKMAMGASA